MTNHAADWGRKAELPEDEEYSPFDAESQDAPVLFLRLVDAELRPRRHLHVEIAGPSGRHSLISDGEGVVFLDGLEPGAYAVSAALGTGLSTASAYTLFFSDLTDDKEPYSLML